MEEHMRIIEVNGIKMEIDTRSAKRVDTFKVGDRVRVLVKSYSGYEVYPGAIVGMAMFKALPTLTIAYLPGLLSRGGEVKFVYLNAQSKDVEIAPMVDDDIVPTREAVLKYFDDAISVKNAEIETIRDKKEWFLRQFGTAFGNLVAEEIATGNDNQF